MDPGHAALRRTADDLTAAHAVGELMLEVAPAHLSDTQAADILAPLCDENGELLDHGLAARRYALTATGAPCTAPSCDSPARAVTDYAVRSQFARGKHRESVSLCGSQAVLPGGRACCEL